jgi:aminoglycoside phosphotransferase (APT) family kinase protein
MSIAEPTDPFEDWLEAHGHITPAEDERARLFGQFVADTTGWDGQQFSLSEDERAWIFRANELIEWVKLYIMAPEDAYMESIKRLAAQLRPMPKSLEID